MILKVWEGFKNKPSKSAERVNKRPIIQICSVFALIVKIFIRVQNFGKFRFGVRRGETEFGELFYGAKFWADFTRQKSETFKVIPVPSHKFSPPNTWSPQLFIKISRSLEKYTWVIIWFIVSHIQSNYNKLFMVQNSLSLIRSQCLKCLARIYIFFEESDVGYNLNLKNILKPSWKR